MAYKRRMHSPAQDVWFAWREIRRSPYFFAFVIVLIAIGTGFNLAVFSLVDALLLKPLPVRAPDELVRFVQILPNIDARSNYPFRFYELMRENSKSFSDVICASSLSTAVRDESGFAARVRCQVVSGNFFTALGVGALYGRVLTPADDVPGSSLPVVLSYPYWQRRFQGDSTIIGKEIRLQDFPFTVVGILPRGFNGVQVETGPDIRAPLRASEQLESEPQLKSYRSRIYEVFARRRPDTGLRQAEAEAQTIFRAALEDENRLYRLDERLEARPIPRGYSVLREKYSGALVLLMAGVALILLMICTNIGGLLLARADGRKLDDAVRLALGATPARLRRQWLALSFLLAVPGTAIGISAVCLTAPLLVRGLPTLRDLDTTILTLSLPLEVDLRLILFAVGSCCASALLAGLPAGVQAARTDLHTSLRAVRSTGRQTLRWTLVGLQAALCTLLLAGTVPLIATFRNLQTMDPGFSRDNVITFSADPSLLAYTGEQTEGLKSRLLAAVREMPDVESAALSSVGLMRGTGLKTTIAPAGQKPTRHDFLNTSIHSVTPEYFETVGIRFLEGRNLRPDEPAAKPQPAVVNGAFARRFFPDRDPIGQRFGAGLNQVVSGDNVVVGVVSDAKYRSLREPIHPIIYYLWSSQGRRGFVLHVRARGRPEALIEPVRHALCAIDPRLPFYDVRTLDEEVRDSMWAERALAWLSTLFSVSAMSLAVLAVYGTLAYAISQGKREIGIRLALGARTADILKLSSTRAMAFVAAGIAAGVAAFCATMPAFRTVLYGIPPAEPVNVALSAAAVLVTAFLAALAVSRVALRIDPAEMLRGE